LVAAEVRICTSRSGLLPHQICVVVPYCPYLTEQVGGGGGEHRRGLNV
jgi:hypothetical protein